MQCNTVQCAGSAHMRMPFCTAPPLESQHASPRSGRICQQKPSGKKKFVAGRPRERNAGRHSTRHGIEGAGRVLRYCTYTNTRSGRRPTLTARTTFRPGRGHAGRPYGMLLDSREGPYGTERVARILEGLYCTAHPAGFHPRLEGKFSFMSKVIGAKVVSSYV